MQKRSSKKKNPRDINVVATRIVKEATSEPLRGKPATMPAKNPAAVELGRLGGLKGGKAGVAKLAPEQRREIAKRAA